LAQAHVLGLEYLLNGGESDVFNLGNGNGFSVREVIETAQAVTGLDIPVIESPRRAGDSPILIGSSDKAKQVLGWHPQYADLKVIVEHAWNWIKKDTLNSDQVLNFSIIRLNILSKWFQLN